MGTEGTSTVAPPDPNGSFNIRIVAARWALAATEGSAPKIGSSVKFGHWLTILRSRMLPDAIGLPAIRTGRTLWGFGLSFW